jgi:type I restriction-modification system DNA methylase subunit/signal transduction histidine kinase
MTLHDAIEIVLESNKRPLTFDEIAAEINTKDLYQRNDLKKIGGAQVRTKVQQYDKLFININGYVVSNHNKKWRNLLSTYWDLSNNLRELYKVSELEFIISCIFYFKRLYDLNDRQFISNVDFIYNLSDNLDSIYISDNTSTLLRSIPHEFYSLVHRESITKFLDSIMPLQHFSSHNFSDEEYGHVFEYILEMNNHGKSKSQLIRTPRQIIELMSKILNPTSGKLYDPVCGTGGFLTQAFRMSKDLEIFGSEISYQVAQIASMNQIMNGDKFANIVYENCFEQIHENIKYDYIIGDLPLVPLSDHNNVVISNLTGLNLPRNFKSFGSFLIFSYFKLSPVGKAVFTVSQSFLFKKGGDEKVRNYFLKKDLIEAVISLPDGSLKPYTTGQVSILVINKIKNNIQKGKVKFINLPDESDFRGIDVNEILEFYSENITNSAYVEIVDVQEVLDLNTLSPASYSRELIEVRKLLQTGTAMYIEDLTKIISGTTSISKEDLNNNYGIPYIKIENLERDILDMFLSKKNVKEFVISDFQKYDRNIISRECLLIAKIGDRLKPTIFRPQNGLDEIILNPNVLALYLDPHSKISLEFLYYQFYSDFLLNQIDQKFNRSVMQFITISAIKELIVPTMDFIDQATFIEFQKATSISEERKRIAERFDRLGYIEDVQEIELNIVRTITHQLKHQLTGLSTSMIKINEVVNKNKLSDYSEYDVSDKILQPTVGFEEPENKKLGEVVDQGLKKAEALNIILRDVDKAITFNLDYSQVYMGKFLDDIIRNYTNKNFSIERFGDDPLIEISTTHFEDLMTTLIKNAEDHGFKSTKSPKILFSTKVDTKRALLVLDYRNNGSPLTITAKEFKSILTKSINSTGSGIGGYYINKIVEAHKGQLIINENLKSGIHFIIELPLKQLENE